MPRISQSVLFQFNPSHPISSHLISFHCIPSHLIPFHILFITSTYIPTTLPFLTAHTSISISLTAPLPYPYPLIPTTPPTHLFRTPFIYPYFISHPPPLFPYSSLLPSHLLTTFPPLPLFPLPDPLLPTPIPTHASPAPPSTHPSIHPSARPRRTSHCKQSTSAT